MGYNAIDPLLLVLNIDRDTIDSTYLHVHTLLESIQIDDESSPKEKGRWWLSFFGVCLGAPSNKDEEEI